MKKKIELQIKLFDCTDNGKEFSISTRSLLEIIGEFGSFQMLKDYLIDAKLNINLTDYQFGDLVRERSFNKFVCNEEGFTQRMISYKLDY